MDGGGGGISDTSGTSQSEARSTKSPMPTQAAQATSNWAGCPPLPPSSTTYVLAPAVMDGVSVTVAQWAESRWAGPLRLFEAFDADSVNVCVHGKALPASVLWDGGGALGGSLPEPEDLRRHSVDVSTLPTSTTDLIEGSLTPKMGDPHAAHAVERAFGAETDSADAVPFRTASASQQRATPLSVGADILEEWQQSHSESETSSSPSPPLTSTALHPVAVKQDGIKVSGSVNPAAAPARYGAPSWSGKPKQGAAIRSPRANATPAPGKRVAVTDESSSDDGGCRDVAPAVAVARPVPQSRAKPAARVTVTDSSSGSGSSP